MTPKERVLDIINELFDYKDGVLHWKKALNRRIKIGSVAGSKSSNGYFTVQIHGKRHFVHRIVFLMFNGHLPKQIDHIDNDRTNNRIENLRGVTGNQNQQNRPLNSNNKSGVKGVHWDSCNRKWKAQVRVNSITKHIGMFTELADAAEAVKQARIKYHGEFANHG